MSLPKVSVLIPCYNAEKYLGDTLCSVLDQTWQNLEVIVVNDGSTDRSADVLRSFSQPNLRVIEQGNRGQTAALNVCLKYASGDFVQYLDADDLISPDKISRQMARLLDRPTCVASAEWGRFYNSPAETRFEGGPVWRDLAPLDWLAEGMRMMFPALWLIPMQIARKAGAWREDLSLNNDAEYFTRVLLASEGVLFCEGARCYYRSGLTNSLSGSKSRTAWLSQYRALEQCELHIMSRENSERMRKMLAIRWQEFAHGAYPYYPELGNRALTRARALHPIRIWPDGGWAFWLLSRLIGWRFARRLQVASGRN